MIVREIIEEPEKYLANFDWFNDAKDTWGYLKSPQLADNADATAARIHMIYSCPPQYLCLLKTPSETDDLSGS